MRALRAASTAVMRRRSWPRTPVPPPSTRARALATSAKDGAGEGYAVQIRNPTALLNAIASTYKSMPRIIMEYVDNALDSAEEGRQKGILAEDRTVDVRIDIDSMQRRIWIRDNCLGMDEEGLMQLVLGIGDSQKRDVEYANGQFGFGAHAFRAAAEHLHVYTSPVQSESGDLCAVVLDRRSSHVPRPQRLSMEDLVRKDDALRDAFKRKVLVGSEDSNSIFPGGSAHGVVVGLLNVDPIWFESVRLTALCRDIENHFEGLLSDRAARITVGQVFRRGKAKKLTRSELECVAFDYEKLAGTRMDTSFEAPDGGTVHATLVVTKDVRPDKRVRFFKGGRAIADAFRLGSFLDVSKMGGRLWEHPGVCGRIEVGKALSPVLTRDEFVRTANRKFVYDELVTLEDKLMQELDKVIQMTTEDTFTELENALGESAANLLRMDEEALLEKDPIDDAVTEEPKEEKKVKKEDEEEKTRDPITMDDVEYSPVVRETRKPKRKDTPNEKGLFEVCFVHAASEDPDAIPQRSFMAENKLYMNVDHEDFTSRLEKDRSGNKVIGARLTAYLSNEIAVHHRLAFDALHKLDRSGISAAESYERLVASINSLEGKLAPSVTSTAASKRRIPASNFDKDA